MDAMDLNWCLTCNRHIDAEGAAPYCSRECLSSDKPSTSALVRPSPFFDPRRVADDLSDLSDELDYNYPEPSTHSYSQCEQELAPVGGRGAWIGKGAAGIHAWARGVKPGPPSDCASVSSTASLRPPKLLLTHCRPVAPTLCMSKTVLAPVEPSRPVLNPRQSLPSLLAHSTTDTSADSCITPSSSVSLATPVSGSEDGAPRRQKTLIGALRAQFRAWAASTAAQNECQRSATLTRESHRTLSRSAREPSLDCVSMEDGYVALAVDGKLALGLAQEEWWESSTFGIVEKVGQAIVPRASRRHMRMEDHRALMARGRKASRGYS
ncbi:hypothetical protein SCP_0902750 [Sparassis crispa]|uniref:Uncharacterized protein n=1 Tax=Sparassis crispa TaxID=139825 RepID=A0A401GVZ7_9APHY|nr:hypothetical protein SCP_0902750 [Sparassis crispa]GBE86396.1 hypothetical protein SCP_0902750 [Sparassis crispa]